MRDYTLSSTHSASKKLRASSFTDQSLHLQLAGAEDVRRAGTFVFSSIFSATIF